MSLLSIIPKGATTTLGIMVVCGVMYFVQGATQQQITQWGVLYAPSVAHGEWWRVISSAFLHSGGMHILFNLGLLFALGQQLEQAIGSIRFGLVYAGSIAVAALAVVVFAPEQPVLGASGGVMGVAAALAVVFLLFSRGKQYQSLLILVAMNVAIPLIIPGISFWGHLGGAVGGLLMIGVLVVLPHQVRSKQIKDGGVYTAERHPMATQSLGLGLILVLVFFASSVMFA